MNLDKKQKILLTLIIIALAYLAWQIYSMFFTGSTTPAPTAPVATKTITEVTPRTPATITSTQTGVSPTATPAATNFPVLAAPLSAQKTTVNASSPAGAPQQLQEINITPPMSAYQSQYLQLVNRYQLIKMRRMIIDEEAAIASSQAKIMQLRQQNNSNNTAATPLSTAALTGITNDNTYQLMYIDYQNGTWSATLSYNNRFIQVYEGTLLPDGTRILRINSNGVVIRRYGKQFLLSFYGNTLLNKNQYVSAPVRPSPMTTQPWTTDKALPSNNRTPGKPVVIPKKLTTHFAPVIFSTTTNKLNSGIAVVEKPQPAALTPSSIQPIPPIPMKKREIEEVPTTHNLVKKQEVVEVQPINIPVKRTEIQEVQTINYPAKKPEIQEVQSVNNEKPLTVLAPPTGNLNLTQQQKSTVTSLENSLAPQSTANSNSQNFTADEKHLLALPKTHYTLQILGSYKITDLTDLVKNHHLQDAYIFHTYYLNRDWYILVYGDYATEDEATNAIRALPPAVQGLKPWVRAISSVQDAINLLPQNG